MGMHSECVIISHTGTAVSPPSHEARTSKGGAPPPAAAAAAAEADDPWRQASHPSGLSMPTPMPIAHRTLAELDLPHAFREVGPTAGTRVGYVLCVPMASLAKHHARCHQAHILDQGAPARQLAAPVIKLVCDIFHSISCRPDSSAAPDSISRLAGRSQVVDKDADAVLDEIEATMHEVCAHAPSIQRACCSVCDSCMPAVATRARQGRGPCWRTLDTRANPFSMPRVPGSDQHPGRRWLGLRRALPHQEQPDVH